MFVHLLSVSHRHCICFEKHAHLCQACPCVIQDAIRCVPKINTAISTVMPAVYAIGYAKAIIDVSVTLRTKGSRPN